MGTSAENRSLHQGWLRREERVYVISITPVGMGPCCIVDKSESAQRRRRTQGRTPECAPLACSINIDLVCGMPFPVVGFKPTRKPAESSADLPGGQSVMVFSRRSNTVAVPYNAISSFHQAVMLSETRRALGTTSKCDSLNLLQSVPITCFHEFCG